MLDPKPRKPLKVKNLDWLKECAISSGPLPAKITGQYFALDIETTGLSVDLHSIVGISVAFNANTAVYCPVAHATAANYPLSECINAIQSWVDAGSTLLAFNYKFDGAFLRKAGLVDDGKFQDVQILLYGGCPELFQQGSGLKALYKKISGNDMLELNELLGITKAEMKRNPPNFASLPVDGKTLSYAGADAIATFRLFQHWIDKKQPGTQHINTLDHGVIPALVEMERTGIPINRDVLGELSTVVEEEREKLIQAMRGAMGAEVNINSPTQLRKYFFVTKEMIPLVQTPKGEASTSTTALKALQRKYKKKHPELNWLIQYRKLDTVRKSYLSPIGKGIRPDTGRVYPQFKGASLITGRIASTGDGVYLEKLNFQAIPKNLVDGGLNIRRMFCVPDGYHWVSIDMSNIEIRLIAEFSRDPRLVDEITQPNGDLHAATAKLVFQKSPEDKDWKAIRKLAKIMNFNLAYAFGITALREKLEEEMGQKVSEDYCWDLYSRFFERAYPVWGEYKKKLVAEARKDNYSKTFWGRRRYLGDFYKKQSFFGCAGDRAAVNFPIQGFAADLMRRALVYCYKYIKEQAPGDVYMLSTVHDEINFLVASKTLENHIYNLEKIISFTPPQFVVGLKATVEVGPNWGELKAYEVV